MFFIAIFRKYIADMAKNHQITLVSGEKITLTERELIFCESYLSDSKRNAAEAARTAGYSLRNAREQAARLLSKANISKYLDSKTKPLLEAMGVTHERLIRERVALAFTNLTDLVDDDWRLKSPSEIDPKFYPALNQVEIEEKVLKKMDGDDAGILVSRKIKYKLNEKEKSLSMLEEASGLVKTKEKEPEPSESNKPMTLFQQINNTYNFNK